MSTKNKHWKWTEKSKKKLSLKRIELIKIGKITTIFTKGNKFGKLAIGISKNVGENNHQYGKPHSKEIREKISNSLKGNIPYNKGLPMSKEQKVKISLIRIEKGLSKGKNNPMWKGGISKEPYSIDWTKELKQIIRERDKYICFICKKLPKILHIHHIDYNKKNCNPDNLIALCISCHGKTNHNRKNWINYFKTNITHNSIG